MPSCEHPEGERHCPNHGPAWADRTAETINEVAKILGWNVSELLQETAQHVVAERDRYREALKRIAGRRPSHEKAAAAFYRSRQDAQEALRDA